MTTKSAWLLTLALLSGAFAQQDVANAAETMRSRLAEAKLEVSFDPAGAATLVREAREAYAQLPADPEVSQALQKAENAAQTGKSTELAAQSTAAWTGVLLTAQEKLEEAIRAGNVAQAQEWLSVREYRVASSLTRLGTDATGALEDLANGKITPEAALKAVRADVLDGYQSRFWDAMRTLKDANAKGYHTLVAEQKALAEGYFSLLAPSYTEQRGQEATKALEAQLAALPASLDKVEEALAGFRAAPLSERERNARASQFLRFLSLVPVEYERGVKVTDGQPMVTQEVEINEARTFLGGAVSALADLSPLLPQSAELSQSLGALNTQLSPESMREKVLPPADLKSSVNALVAQAKTVIPADWQKTDAGADLGVVRTQLDAVVTAARAGDWAAAENARLDAYSLLESGTEARIAVFNPELKTRLENLIWNGQSPKGFASLIHEKAPASEFVQTRTELAVVLREVSRILGTEVAPAAVATNAGIIVFREGLEAVLILAALMGSLRKGELIKLRRPMWLGAAGAGVATAATWWIMSQTLSLLGKYGEKLEAVVSVIAIGVLLLIMNWFFHQVYWTDRMASFQKHKHELAHKPAARQHQAQWWGLAVLGFTSIYREGFETVLFLQSLVLQAGAGAVLAGTAAGLAAVVGVGVLVFQLQAKLPMKKLLIWTGMLICAVLGVMVGNTVHTLQLVGWMTVHPLPFELPAALGLWIGLHPTWEGVVLQIMSMVMVVGSFFAAEELKKREMAAKRTQKKPAISKLS